MPLLYNSTLYLSNENLFRNWRSLFQLQFSLCLYVQAVVMDADEAWWNGDINTRVQATCTGGGVSSGLYDFISGALSMLPFAIRLIQSLKALMAVEVGIPAPLQTSQGTLLEQSHGVTAADLIRKRRRHALNSAKYVASMTLVAVSLSRATKDKLRMLWICLSVFTTVINYSWDVVIDWGLTSVNWVAHFSGSEGVTKTPGEGADGLAWGLGGVSDIDDREENALIHHEENYDVLLHEDNTNGGGESNKERDGHQRDLSTGYESTRIAYERRVFHQVVDEQRLSTCSRLIFLTRAMAVPRGRKYPAWTYLAAVLSNAVLRFGWAIYVSPKQTIVAQHTILLLGCAELLRRFVWVLIRVEWEEAQKEAPTPKAKAITQGPSRITSSWRQQDI